MVKGNENEIPQFYRADSRARREALARRQIIKNCREYVEQIYQARISRDRLDPFEMDLPEFVACLMPTVNSAYCTARKGPICYACSGSTHHCPFSVVQRLYSIGAEFESARNLLWEGGLDGHVIISRPKEIPDDEDQDGNASFCANLMLDSKGNKAYRCKIFEFCGYSRRLAHKCSGYEPTTETVPTVRASKGLPIPVQEAVLRSSTQSRLAMLGTKYEWEDPDEDWDPDAGIIHFGPLRHWAGIPNYDLDTLTLAKDLLKEVWYFTSMYRYVVPQPEWKDSMEYMILSTTPEMQEVDDRLGALKFTRIVDRDANWVKSKK